MKYLCLGYRHDNLWEEMPDSERQSLLQECAAYEDVLRKNGHYLDGTVLQGPRAATTLRFERGKMSVTDGPFAETKEQLGGVIMLEAKDLNHAIQLMSQLPGMRVGGCVEIRPIDET